MTYPRFLVPLVLVTTLSAAAVHAQSSPPPPHQPPSPSMTLGSPGQPSTDAPSFSDLAKGGKWLKRSDLPSDVEALKKVRAHFNEADSNHDGRLDQDEYNAAISNSVPTHTR